MVTPRFREYFPHVPDSVQITSPQTPEYNCFAWVTGTIDAWWEPGRTWPIDASTDWNVDAIFKAYESQGFTGCQDGALEPNFEKIAFYCNEEGEPTHVAKQLPTGRWSSKLGTWEDVEHELPDFEGAHPAYGQVRAFMKRLRAPA